MCGSPRPSCEGSWPLWLRRPGAEVSCAAQLLGRACPPRLLPSASSPAPSAALRAPAPSPNSAQGPGDDPRRVPDGSRSLGPLGLSPARVPASALLLTAVAVVVPRVPALSSLLPNSSLEETGIGESAGSGRGPWDVFLPKESFVCFPYTFVPRRRGGAGDIEEKFRLNRLGLPLLNFSPPRQASTATPLEGSRTSANSVLFWSWHVRERFWSERMLNLPASIRLRKAREMF